MIEIDIDDRPPEIELKEDIEYVIMITYSLTAKQNFTIASKPMYKEDILDKLDEIINDIEQNRMIRFNQSYIYPKRIVSVFVQQNRTPEEIESDKKNRKEYQLKKQAEESAIARVQNQIAYEALTEGKKNE